MARPYTADPIYSAEQEVTRSNLLDEQQLNHATGWFRHMKKLLTKDPRIRTSTSQLLPVYTKYLHLQRLFLDKKSSEEVETRFYRVADQLRKIMRESGLPAPGKTADRSRKKPGIFAAPRAKREAEIARDSVVPGAANA